MSAIRIIAIILLLAWTTSVGQAEEPGMAEADRYWKQQRQEQVSTTKPKPDDPVRPASLSTEEPTATQGGLSLSPLNSYLEDCGVPVRLKPEAVWDSFTTLLVNYQPTKVGWTPKREWRMLENMDGTANVFFRCFKGSEGWYRQDALRHMPERMEEFDRGLAKRHQSPSDFSYETHLKMVAGQLTTIMFVRANNMPTRHGKEIIWSQINIIFPYQKDGVPYVFVVLFRENVQYPGAERDDWFYANEMTSKFIPANQRPAAVAAGGG